MVKNSASWLHFDNAAQLQTELEHAVNHRSGGVLVLVDHAALPTAGDYPCMASMLLTEWTEGRLRLRVSWFSREMATAFVAASAPQVATDAGVGLVALTSKLDKVTRMLDEQDEYNRKITAWLYSLTELAAADVDMARLERTFYRYQRIVDEAITQAKYRLAVRDVIDSVRENREPDADDI